MTTGYVTWIGKDGVSSTLTLRVLVRPVKSTTWVIASKKDRKAGASITKLTKHVVILRGRQHRVYRKKSMTYIQAGGQTMQVLIVDKQQ